MKRLLLQATALLTSFTLAYGLRLPVKRRLVPRGATGHVFSPVKAPTLGTDESGANDHDVKNVMDLRYTTTININGKDVLVVLDTGSTDLWVIPPGGLGQYEDTGLELELRYGDGSYGVTGTVGIAPFQFGPYHIERQAFMHAEQSTIGLMTELEIYGVMGLSFNQASASPINELIQKTYGASATWGDSVLHNIFNQHPTQPNFIGIDLARTDDLEDTADGSFTIGEYEPDWIAIKDTPKLSQYPPGSDRWTVILDGVTVDGEHIDISSSGSSLPNGKAIALLDTGDPQGVFPTAVVDAIYSRVPDSVKFDNGGNPVWVCPCNTTASVEMIFGDRSFPIHPLDLTILSDPINVMGRQYTACIASFKGADGWGQSAYDISLGDTFLRNVYSLYDFGDNAQGGESSGPYMQLLSQIDVNAAAAEVTSVRSKTMANKPPEVNLHDLLSMLSAGSSDSSAANADDGHLADFENNSTSTDVPVPSSTQGVDVTLASSVQPLTETSVPTSASSSEDSDRNATISKYAPWALGLLAANFLIGVCLLLLGILNCIRRGSPKQLPITKSSSPHYVRVRDDEAASSLYATR